jgi:hypothetical protein
MMIMMTRTSMMALTGGFDPPPPALAAMVPGIGDDGVLSPNALGVSTRVLEELCGRATGASDQLGAAVVRSLSVVFTAPRFPESKGVGPCGGF